ncbi:hypothetical protein AA313_de0206103 [Arthrobotrys entomopaga]|nr:hypothetical protein AA313_de0206103 [Arthrobotrys entomopaga]
MFKSRLLSALPIWLSLWNLHSKSVVYAQLGLSFDTNTPYGYDGPWYGVPIKIGSDKQTVNLFPATQDAFTILSTATCDTYTGCDASEKGGLYNVSSDSRSYNNTIDVQYLGLNAIPYGVTWGTRGVSTAQFAQLELGQGPDALTVVNASVMRVDDITMFFGTSADRSVGMSNGFLSLGGVEDEQIFGSYEAAVPLNYLANRSFIPSRSWGMHYPSAKLNQIPSLVWGGYDKSRIAGPVQSFDLNIGGLMKMNLIGINIDIAVGKSPFPYQRKSNLLFINQTNQNPHTLNVLLESAIPYLVLPQETCDVIAKELPVTFDATLGFYLWRTDDPLYHSIVTSSAYLSFDFEISVSQNLTIKIPFSLLDLNFTFPLVTENKPYFPCLGTYLSTDGSGATLGRTFYQAAFIAKAYIQRKFWVAQAPGPSYIRPDIKAIISTTLTLDAPENLGDDETWISSWNSTWKVTPLPDDAQTPTSPTSTGDPSSTPDPNPKQGIPMAAMIGIGVGTGIAILALLVLVLLLRWRKKKKEEEAMVGVIPERPTPTLIPATPRDSWMPWNWGNNRRYLNSQRYSVHELSADQYWELPVNKVGGWDGNEYEGEPTRPATVHPTH